jgi:hypothetical protein
MDALYSSRAIVNSSPDGVEIIIPAYKNTMTIALCVAMLAIGLTVLTRILNKLPDIGGSTTIVEIVISFVIIYYGVRSLLWALSGREVILADKKKITIKKENSIYNTSNDYEVNKISGLVVYEETVFHTGIFRLGNFLWALAGNTGNAICFDYEGDTVKFGNSLVGEEAQHLVSILKQGSFAEHSR